MKLDQFSEYDRMKSPTPKFCPIASLKRSSLIDPSPNKKLKAADLVEIDTDPVLMFEDGTDNQDKNSQDNTEIKSVENDSKNDSFINELETLLSNGSDVKAEDKLNEDSDMEQKVTPIKCQKESDIKSSPKVEKPAGSLFLFGTNFFSANDNKDDDIISEDDADTEASDEVSVDPLNNSDVSNDLNATSDCDDNDSVKGEADVKDEIEITNTITNNSKGDSKCDNQNCDTKDESDVDIDQEDLKLLNEFDKQESKTQENVSKVVSPKKYKLGVVKVWCEKVPVPEYFRELQRKQAVNDESKDDQTGDDTNDTSETESEHILTVVPAESPPCIDIDSDDDTDDNIREEATDEDSSDVHVVTDVIELEIDNCELDLRPLCDNETCDQCGASGDTISMFSPTPGTLSQSQAVRDPRLSAIPWEWSVDEGLDVCYKAKNVCIYDQHGHMAAVDKVSFFSFYTFTMNVFLLPNVSVILGPA